MCPYVCFQTLGAEFVVKTVRIPESDNLAVELYLFDTSGHAIYKELRPTYVSRSKRAGSAVVMDRRCTMVGLRWKDADSAALPLARWSLPVSALSGPARLW